MNNKTRFNVGYAIAAIFAVLLIQYAISTANQIAVIPYSEFQRLLRQSKVATVAISDRMLPGHAERAAGREGKSSSSRRGSIRRFARRA